MVPREGDPAMVVRLLEETNILGYSWVENSACVLGYADRDVDLFS